MKRLEQLPEITDEMLGGLTATQELKNDILWDAQRVAQGQTVQRNTPWREGPVHRSRSAQFLRTAGALACLVLFVAGMLIGVPGLLSRSVTQAPLIDTQTAGDPPALTGGASVALDMPKGSVIISQRSPANAAGVWEAAQGANFPLVYVQGRYYRMTVLPETLDERLLGDALAAVDTFTSEPALATQGTVSNIVPEGETVYAVRGLEGAAVAARVNGKLRLFQRVSYGATALTAGEKLRDTLGALPVEALEITGVGAVTDPAKAQELYSLLLQKATLSRAAAADSNQTLLIGLENGLVLQMCVRDESLMACGTWSCPEFFEAFEDAVK